jgi:hypothetical protein
LLLGFFSFCRLIWHALVEPIPNRASDPVFSDCSEIAIGQLYGRFTCCISTADSTLRVSFPPGKPRSFKEQFMSKSLKIVIGIVILVVPLGIPAAIAFAAYRRRCNKEVSA